MSRLTAQLAELALRHIDAAFVETETADGLSGAAAWLPAAPLLGLEARLGPSGGPIDVSQRFRRDDATLPYLERYVAARRSEAAPASAWHRLDEFCRWWSDHPDRVRELWLEVDANAGDTPLPSLFVEFDRPIGEDSAIADGIALLVGDNRHGWARLCEALIAAHAMGIEVGPHLGLMLGRDGAARATFRRLGMLIIPFLRNLSWTGPLTQVDAILACPAIVQADHQLALDFAPELRATAGIEILFDARHDGLASLAAVLDAFIAQGWATPERCRGLLSWTGMIRPDTAAAPWPDAMVLGEMLSPSSPPRMLVRHIGHLKLNLAPDTSPLAKAYFALIAQEARFVR